MAYDLPTIVAANNAGNDDDYDAWVALDQAIAAGNAGQMQGYKNKLHNGACQIWQRGTSFASGATFTSMDRWQFRRDSNATGATLSRQAGFSGARYCARVQRDNGNATLENVRFGINLETADAVALAGQTVIVSWDCRKGATYSETASQMSCRIRTGTGIDEARSPGFAFPTGAGGVGFVSSTIGTTEARCTYGPYTLDSSLTEFGVDFGFLPTGTAGASDYFEITNIQLEIVDPSDGIASPFEARPFALELAICERYLQKSFLYATAPAQNVGINTGEHICQAWTAGATTQRSPRIPFRQRMRAAPTVTLYNPAAASAHARDETNSQNCTATATVNIGEEGFAYTCTGNAATTVGAHLGLHWLASAEY